LHKSGDRVVSGSKVADVSDSCKSEVFHRGSVFLSNEYPELDNPAAHLSQIELMNATCLSFFKSKTALGQFARESLKPVSACIVQGEDQSSLMWPVPPPRWRWSACKRLGFRRRKRKRFFQARAMLLQSLVIGLNWETLGHSLKPPAKARVGFPINQHQHSILERLETKLTHFLRIGEFVPDDLGRASDKFQGVIKNMKELPRCTLGLQDLEQLFNHIQHGISKGSSDMGQFEETQNLGGSPADPSSGSQVRASAKSSHDVHPGHCCVFDTSRSAQTLACGSRPVVADRVKWKNPPSFDPVPFLKNPLVRAAYKDPEALRKSPDQWPTSNPGKVFCTKPELLKLAGKWDSLDACCLFDAREKDWHEAVGLFCVAKDSDFDRLIMNPKAINSRMHTISEATKTLAPGAMLGLLHLRDDQFFRVCADDLTDFYYTFKISRARALRNCIRMKFHPEEVQHFRCFHDGLRNSKEILFALNTLAMGDSLAVEIAQAAHAEVLRQLCGAMISKEVLRYRHPVPRGDCVELLAIDDHVTLQKVLKTEYPLNPRKRDTLIFEASGRAYQQVQLIQQEKKRKRNLLQATILGCHFDGEEGIASAPRGRLAVLAFLTMRVVILGTCTPKLLSTILGCWIHALLFRRVLFSVLDAVFAEGRGKGQHEVFCLSPQAKNELELLSVLSTMAHSDLRVNYSPYIYTTDASPWGGAVCKAQIGQTASAELWRHCEQKGFYTRLENPVSAILSEKGIDHEGNLFGEPTAQEDHSKPIIFHPLPSLSEGILFDAIELFRGSGNWSEAHVAMGLSVHDGLDTDGRRLRCLDLSDMSVFREISSLALRRVVREWHAGVPCLCYGNLRRPRVRSKEQPYMVSTLKILSLGSIIALLSELGLSLCWPS